MIALYWLRSGDAIREISICLRHRLDDSTLRRIRHRHHGDTHDHRATPTPSPQYASALPRASVTDSPTQNARLTKCFSEHAQPQPVRSMHNIICIFIKHHTHNYVITYKKSRRTMTQIGSQCRHYGSRLTPHLMTLEIKPSEFRHRLHYAIPLTQRLQRRALQTF